MNAKQKTKRRVYNARRLAAIRWHAVLAWFITEKRRALDQLLDAHHLGLRGWVPPLKEVPNV